MRTNRSDSAIALVIAIIFLGVVAASITRVSLMEPQEASAAADKAQSDKASLLSMGKKLFAANCAGCHPTDKTEGKYAPGFKGLSKAGKLPASGRKASEANIRTQLKTPLKNMPAFDKLTDREIKALAAYVLSL